MGSWLDRLAGKRAVLIAGPTASGKSTLALRLAEALARVGRRAAIVNADSMQVYGELRIVTARPQEADEARAPHHLFGTVPARQRFSTGLWLAAVAPVLAKLREADTVALVTGGTGFYFKALTEGLADVPEIPAAVRAHWQAELERRGVAALHRVLAERDAGSAEMVRPTDPQRVLRALEVLEATGRPLRAWQEGRSPALLPAGEAERVVVEPDRDWLAGRIAERTDAMVRGGAVEEVRALLALELAPDLPAMKAIGVAEFGAFLRGSLSLPQATELARTQTRRYAKRQRTWFRHQMPDWERVAPKEG